MTNNVMAANMDQTVLLSAAIVFTEISATIKMAPVQGNATVATKGHFVLKLAVITRMDQHVRWLVETVSIFMENNVTT